MSEPYDNEALCSVPDVTPYKHGEPREPAYWLGPDGLYEVAGDGTLSLIGSRPTTRCTVATVAPSSAAI